MGICHGVQISVPGTTSEPPSEIPRHELARLGRNASLQFAHLIALHTPVLLPTPVIGGLGRPDGPQSNYDPPRDWLKEIDALCDLCTIKGTNWEEEISSSTSKI